MAPKRLKVTGIDELTEELAKYSDNESVYILFCGSKTAEGQSWCPDCVKAEPFVNKEINKLSGSDIFIYCDVGPREEWKNPKNSFRTNEKFKLTAVPTLIKWNSPKRLIEEQCCNESLLQLLLEDD